MIRRAFITLLLALAAPAWADAPSAPLDYRERVTAGGDPSKPLPMVIAVHGLGDRPESFAGLFDSLPVPVRVILPRGPIPWGRGASWFAISRPPDAEMVAQMTRSADAIIALATTLAATRPTVGRPILTGFS